MGLARWPDGVEGIKSLAKRFDINCRFEEVDNYKQVFEKVYGNQAAVIFYRSWERSQLIYKSMLSRGFAGEFPESEEMKLRVSDIIFSFLFIGLLLLTRLTA